MTKNKKVQSGTRRLQENRKSWQKTQRIDGRNTDSGDFSSTDPHKMEMVL
jgi:hypothetical protein